MLDHLWRVPKTAYEIGALSEERRRGKQQLELIDFIWFGKGTPALAPSGISTTPSGLCLPAPRRTGRR
jgi:hypothetical protein